MQPQFDRADRQAARMTSLLGLAFAALFLAGLALLARSPSLRASDQELAVFYGSGETRWILFGGLYVLPFSAVAFLWFIAALRQWVERSGRTIDHLLATVQMLSGVGFITLAFAAAGAATIVAGSVDLANLPVDPEVARQFPLFSRTLLIIFGMRMAAIFVTTTARLGAGGPTLPAVVHDRQLWRRRGALPRRHPECLARRRLSALDPGALRHRLEPRALSPAVGPAA